MDEDFILASQGIKRATFPNDREKQPGMIGSKTPIKGRCRNLGSYDTPAAPETPR